MIEIIKGKRYVKCEKNPDGSLDCVAYKPTKSGKKIVTATTKSVLTPDCQIAHENVEGDVGDLEFIEDYLNKRNLSKCKSKSEL